MKNTKASWVNEQNVSMVFPLCPVNWKLMKAFSLIQEFWTLLRVSGVGKATSSGRNGIGTVALDAEVIRWMIILHTLVVLIALSRLPVPRFSMSISVTIRKEKACTSANFVPTLVYVEVIFEGILSRSIPQLNNNRFRLPSWFLDLTPFLFVYFYFLFLKCEIQRRWLLSYVRYGTSDCKCWPAEFILPWLSLLPTIISILRGGIRKRK